MATSASMAHTLNRDKSCDTSSSMVDFVHGRGSSGSEDAASSSYLSSEGEEDPRNQPRTSVAAPRIVSYLGPFCSTQRPF